MICAGDIWRYRGNRPRKALPEVSVIEVDEGRVRVLFTYAFGAVRERRLWMRGATLFRSYRLVARQEKIE